MCSTALLLLLSGACCARRDCCRCTLPNTADHEASWHKIPYLPNIANPLDGDLKSPGGNKHAMHCRPRRASEAADPRCIVPWLNLKC